ncbi:MAG: RsmF rRNA methyltransferase first C-terminal domain-containing protein [Lachnospiraceae bacterium]|nr:RsmF rRNA methyltransferase first C-terminal domain-containing protein [Lachnospiraceae bacterium]
MLPVRFCENMKALLKDEYEAFIAGYESESCKALRLNPLKTGKAQFLALSLFHLCPVPWEDMGFYYSEEDFPGKHPLHEAGVYYIQEPSAMYPVNLLFEDDMQDPESPDPLHSDQPLTILDLCAAPGGKTTQIAGRMKGRGVLVANEIHQKRAEILSENIERLGVTNALVLNETPDRLEKRFPGYFNRILVDAPCSGEGMFRKNEEAVKEWSPENVEMCAKRQDDILDKAVTMLKYGGILVYSTCTFNKEEDEDCIGRLLSRHEDLKFICEKKLYPHRIEGEGQYAAKLVKIGPRGGSSGHLQPSKLSVRKNALPFLKIFEGFARENLINDGDYVSESGALNGQAVRPKAPNGQEVRSEAPNGQEVRPGEVPHDDGMLPLALRVFNDLKKYGGITCGEPIAFGDNLYIAPEGFTDLGGLKCLRPGLHLGSIKKGRFEPSHALALTLKPENVKRYVNLTDPESAESYLKGMTFYHEGEKGFHLICAEGYSLGWGKLAGNIMKNHYPKGLRRV